MSSQRRIAAAIAVVLITSLLPGCTFFRALGAMRTFREANLEYRRGQYNEAIELYEEVVATIEQPGADNDLLEQLKVVYFYIGNSYDNLYQPGINDPENLHVLEQAIHFYRVASEESPTQQLRDDSMRFLVSTYGADKSNDPASADPILREMILADPENTENYFRLGQLYEESGLYEEVEAVYDAVRSFRGDDPSLYLQIAGFYSRTGDFQRTMEALEERARIDPDNPEAFYTISTYYWEKAFRDFRITEDEKMQYILAGIDAADRALALNDRYVEALVYKNILLRLQANATEDLDEREALIAQADDLRDLAQKLNDEQAMAAEDSGEEAE